MPTGRCAAATSTSCATGWPSTNRTSPRAPSSPTTRGRSPSPPRTAWPARTRCPSRIWPTRRSPCSPRPPAGGLRPARPPVHPVGAPDPPHPAGPDHQRDPLAGGPGPYRPPDQLDGPHLQPRRRRPHPGRRPASPAARAGLVHQPGEPAHPRPQRDRPVNDRGARRRCAVESRLGRLRLAPADPRRTALPRHRGPGPGPVNLGAGQRHDRLGWATVVAVSQAGGP
jgi:hypothetical protein